MCVLKEKLEGAEKNVQQNGRIAVLFDFIKEKKRIILILLFLLIGYLTYEYINRPEARVERHRRHLEGAITEVFPEGIELERYGRRSFLGEEVFTFSISVRLSPDYFTIEEFGTVVLRLNDIVYQTINGRRMEGYFSHLSVALQVDNQSIIWGTAGSAMGSHMMPGFGFPYLYGDGSIGYIVIDFRRVEGYAVLNLEIPIEEIQSMIDSIYALPEIHNYVSERLYDVFLLDSISIEPIWLRGAHFPWSRLDIEHNAWDVEKIPISIFLDRELVSINEFEEHVKSVIPYVYSMFDDLNLIPFDLSISRRRSGEGEFSVDWFPQPASDYGVLHIVPGPGEGDRIIYESLSINQLQSTIDFYLEEK